MTEIQARINQDIINQIRKISDKRLYSTGRDDMETNSFKTQCTRIYHVCVYVYVHWMSYYVHIHVLSTIFIIINIVLKKSFIHLHSQQQGILSSTTSPTASTVSHPPHGPARSHTPALTGGNGGPGRPRSAPPGHRRPSPAAAPHAPERRWVPLVLQPTSVEPRIRCYRGQHRPPHQHQRGLNRNSGPPVSGEALPLLVGSC